MIIDRLIVERYGHFERLELDLGAGRGGLSVIYGANEAGKSTLLQSIRDLFFGIDARTPLAFRYDYKSILLRAKLRDSAGQRLDVERRKKRKASLTGTLSSQAGVMSLDGADFAGYFGGVKAELYNALFGFSLDDLQRGAEALESAGLKEVLGGSALGGAGDRIAEVLASLEGEARDLYLKQGRVRSINVALTKLKETQQELRDSTLQQSAYQSLTGRQASIREQFEAAERELKELRARRDRASLLVRAASDFAELETLEQELERSVGDLGEEEARDALRLLAQATAARTRLESLDAELARLQERVAGLEVEEALLQEEVAIDRLGRDLGRWTALGRELPAERASLEAELRRLEGEAGESGRVDEEPSAALVERLRVRTRSWREAADAVGRASRDDHNNRAEIEAARKLLGGGLDDASDSETLFLATELEELSERRAQQERLAAEIKRYEVEIARALEPFELGVDVGVDPSAVESLAKEVPGQDILKDSLGALEALDERSRRLASERARIAARLEGQSTKPSQAGPKKLAARDALTKIEDARARRTSAWEDLRQAWLTGPERITELERYGILRSVEAAIEAADTAADHLRDHADQLARLRAEDLEIASATEAKAQHDADEAQLAKERARWRSGWDKLWTTSAYSPRPAEAMAYLRAIEVLREDSVSLANARRRAEELRPTIADYEARLRRHLGQERASWPLLVKLLRERAGEAQARRGRRASTRERLLSLEASRELTQGLLESAKQALAEIHAELRGLLGEVGLDPEQDPEQALRRLERRALLREQGSALTRRQEALATKEAEFAAAQAEAQSLLARLGAEATQRTLAASIEELGRRLTIARGNALARDHARHNLSQRQPLREQASADLAGIHAELANLRRRCGVVEDDDEQLAVAAEQALRRDSLAARRTELRRRVEQHLDDAGDRRLAFETELRDCDPIALREELRTIEPRLAARERERTDLAGQQGKLDQEIESLGGDRAARLGAEAQTLLADLGEQVDRYVLVHVAHRILDAVTERFARESQPTILQQVSSLLARITGGRHLRVSADRQAGTLLVHDANGLAREPKQLSTGTREQLFLALRLAYVLEYCDRAEPLPVIIDDVLVNFDRGRARTTLATLSEVAKSTQVLLFTCHEHIVDLIRDVGPEIPVFVLPPVDRGHRAVDAVTLRAEPQPRPQPQPQSQSQSQELGPIGEEA